MYPGFFHIALCTEILEIVWVIATAQVERNTMVNMTGVECYGFTTIHALTVLFFK